MPGFQFHDRECANTRHPNQRNDLHEQSGLIPLLSPHGKHTKVACQSPRLAASRARPQRSAETRSAVPKLISGYGART